MERLTWLTRFAFAALVTLAVVSCGGDDGAGTADGNGTDDGNGDDAGDPNPLIEKIPGLWYLEGTAPEDHADEVVVDTSDPTCATYWGGTPPTYPRPQDDANPPGDACIRPPAQLMNGLEGLFAVILDGNRVRLTWLNQDGSTDLDFDGTVTEDGRRIDVSIFSDGDTFFPWFNSPHHPAGETVRNVYHKLR